MTAGVAEIKTGIAATGKRILRGKTIPLITGKIASLPTISPGKTILLSVLNPDRTIHTP
jgi:hypothetical protein